MSADLKHPSQKKDKSKKKTPGKSHTQHHVTHSASTSPVTEHAQTISQGSTDTHTPSTIRTSESSLNQTSTSTTSEEFAAYFANFTKLMDIQTSKINEKIDQNINSLRQEFSSPTSSNHKNSHPSDQVDHITVSNDMEYQHMEPAKCAPNSGYSSDKNDISRELNENNKMLRSLIKTVNQDNKKRHTRNPTYSEASISQQGDGHPTRNSHRASSSIQKNLKRSNRKDKHTQTLDLNMM